MTLEKEECLVSMFRFLSFSKLRIQLRVYFVFMAFIGTWWYLCIPGIITS